MVRDISSRLGDSIASGEGNPDRPIALSDEVFASSYSGQAGAQYYRRAAAISGRACELLTAAGMAAPERALFNSACHRCCTAITRTRWRSPCNIRTSRDLPAARLHRRTIPDGCSAPTGAGMPADENPQAPAWARQRTIGESAKPLLRKRRQPNAISIILLSIGPMTSIFRLVADVIVDTPTERVLFRRTAS